MTAYGLIVIILILAIIFLAVTIVTQVIISTTNENMIGCDKFEENWKQYCNEGEK